MNTIGTSR